MPERRFRDMRLTTDDMWSRIGDHIGRNYDPDGYGYSKQCARLEARAKRLLPLWRDIGLRELRYDGWIDGHNHATSREESPF